MAMFQKKGVNKENGNYVYPEFTQTGTGNCAAYAGAACLYAFGKDHEPGLIPPASGGSPGEQFQAQAQRMVERLTDLIYTQGNSVAEGYRKYIEEKGLSDKFEVTEMTGDSYTLPDGSSRPNWEFVKDELRRCQDIMVHVKWPKGTCKKDARHSVTLVGFDEAANKALVMNPWGNPRDTTNVPPAEAGANTAAGQTDRAHSPYDFTLDGDTVKVDVEGNKATVYEYVKICPAPPKAVKVSSAATELKLGPRGTSIQRYEYAMLNESMHGVTALAIGIPGLQPAEVAGLHAPPGWSGTIWYRENNPHFDLPAPERLMLPTVETDPVGIIFRADKSSEGPFSLEGFAIDIVEPALSEDQLVRLEEEMGSQSDDLLKALRRARLLFAKSRKWESVTGQAVVVAEYAGGTHAVHTDALVPRRICNAADRIGPFLREQGLI